MQLVLSIPDVTKSKGPGDSDPARGMKIVGDRAAHKELPQEDPLFSWDDMNRDKEYLAQTL